jgi:hypothetical protein
MGAVPPARLSYIHSQFDFLTKYPNRISCGKGFIKTTGAIRSHFAQEISTSSRVSHDKEAGEVTIRTGMTLAEAGEEFEQRDLALHNYGDVNLQAVVGAVGTGTHGTGRKLQILSAPLVGVRLVTAAGQIQEFSEQSGTHAARKPDCVLSIFPGRAPAGSLCPAP